MRLVSLLWKIAQRSSSNCRFCRFRLLKSPKRCRIIRIRQLSGHCNFSVYWIDNWRKNHWHESRVVQFIFHCCRKYFFGCTHAHIAVSFFLCCLRQSNKIQWNLFWGKREAAVPSLIYFGFRLTTNWKCRTFSILMVQTQAVFEASMPIRIFIRWILLF